LVLRDRFSAGGSTKIGITFTGRQGGGRLVDANDHNAGSRIAIDNAPNAGKAGQSLDKIYKPVDIGSDQWASYFASLSPEEDFVETYKFRVHVVPDQNQLGPNIQDLIVKIPNGKMTGQPSNQNVGRDYAGNQKLRLQNKVQCITALIP